MATVYHSNGSAASIQPLHNTALTGDKITVPSGTFTWTNRVTITKAIMLQGQGIGHMIIRHNVQGRQFLTFTVQANKLPRLTRIEFRKGRRSRLGLHGSGFFGELSPESLRKRRLSMKSSHK
jgi:hypothetical protein